MWGKSTYLNHFLMSSLHGTIALIDMIDIAVLVAKDLNLEKKSENVLG